MREGAFHWNKIREMQAVVVLHLTFMLYLGFDAGRAVFRHPTKFMLRLPLDLSVLLNDAAIPVKWLEIHVS